LLTHANDHFSMLAIGVDSMHDMFVEMHLENEAILLTKQVVCGSSDITGSFTCDASCNALYGCGLR
jgi:hypothetical protein